VSRYADDFVCAFRYREDAERFYRVLPKRLKKFGLEVAPDKTRCLRFSRFHPSRKRRFTFLGFEFLRDRDRQGVSRVKRRTAPKKLQGACRRIKEWVLESRHEPGREFFRGLNRRLRGHYNYYGLRGNSGTLYRFYRWAITCTFKWFNRRGGKRSSFTWASFTDMLERVGIARPRITEVAQRRVLA
jgi:RNA-directed DNA polymerase